MPDNFNILDYTAGPLLKTGQNTDRTPAGRTTKDDGGFQRGIIGSKDDAQYVVYTTGQYSGVTSITVNSIAANQNNNAVLDKVTGLMWSRDQSPSVYGTGAQDLQWSDTTNNEDIFEFCDQANLSGLSGFSDWRVPNIMEFYSLMFLRSGFTPAVNQTIFPTWVTGNMWTSTADPIGGGALYLNVGLGSGKINSTFMTARNKVVLCRLGIISSL